MIDVNEIKEFADYISNKEQSGNSYTPDQFNLLLRRSNDDIFTKYYGLAERYQPGRPVPPIAYELTQLIKDYLKPFLKTETIAFTNGFGPIPEDYQHYTSFTYQFVSNDDCTTGGATSESRPVDVIDDDKWDGRKSHSIRGGNIKYPAVNFNATTIEVDPSRIISLQIKYLKKPESPLWAYTIVDDVAVYNAAASINMDLPDVLTNEVTRLILGYVGINLRDQQLQAYAEQRKMAGI